MHIFEFNILKLIVKKQVFLMLFLMGSTILFSQNVTVDQTTYTVEELVTDVLIDSPCAEVSNITWSTGTNFGQVNGIGYFNSNGGSFPFEEGIILSLVMQLAPEDLIQMED